MTKKIDDDERNKKLDELSMMGFELDDICNEIWLTLMAKGKLRFNELHTALKMFGADISKPSLVEHLKHLIERKLIERKEEGFQNVSYGLTKEIDSLLTIPQKDVAEWLKDFEKSTKKLPEHIKLVKINAKQFYEKLPEQQLDQQIARDLEFTSCLNFHELKNMINYNLRIGKHESDEVFWKFFANPLYRMHERSIAEKCRNSEKYRKKLFEQIDTLIDLLSGGEKLPKS